MKKLALFGATLSAVLTVTPVMAEDNAPSTNTSKPSVQNAPPELKDAQMDKITGGAITTSNPGGQSTGCGGGNPNCQSVNPAGSPPPGHNK